MLSIGKPIQSPTAQNAVAWEFAYQLKIAPDNVFMNISETQGKELYDMARDKGSLLFKKLTDQGDTTRSDFCNYYLPKYAYKTFVDGETVEKFLGLYSLVHTMRVFTASIIFITNGLTSYEAVLCVAGGQNRPTYIFDAAQGTLQQVTNLYDSIFEYVPQGSHIMAYIVSSDSTPIVMQKAETPKPEEVDTPAKKRDETKEAVPAEKRSEEEKTPKKKKAVPAEKKRERSEEKEEEPKKKKAVAKQKIVPEDSSSADKKTTTPSSSGKKKKKEEEEEENQEEVEKPKKKPIVRRKRIAETE